MGGGRNAEKGKLKRVQTVFSGSKGEPPCLTYGKHCILTGLLAHTYSLNRACIMNNSYLCWPLCAPPLLAPHTLFVVVLFSSCESTQHFSSPLTSGPRGVFGCLQLGKRRLNSQLLFYLFIYFYHCWVK